MYVYIYMYMHAVFYPICTTSLQNPVRRSLLNGASPWADRVLDHLALVLVERCRTVGMRQMA